MRAIMADIDDLRESILTEFKQVYKLHPADYTENCTNVVVSMVKDLFSRESSKREAEIRLDEVKLYTNSINETGGGFDPIQYEKNRQQDLEKTDNIFGSKIVIDTHMEKMGKVASMIEKSPGAQDSYKDRLTQLLDRFRLQWKIEGDEYHQSELEDDIIRLFTDSIGVFEVTKGDGSQQDKLTNERNSIRDKIMEKWGLYDD